MSLDHGAWRRPVMHGAELPHNFCNRSSVSTHTWSERVSPDIERYAVIKEQPASWTKVVLAFAATALVGALPVILLALTHAELRAAVDEAAARYGGTVVVTLAAASAVAVSAWFLAPVVRRKPRAVRA